MDTLRLVQIVEGDGYRVDITFVSPVGYQSAMARFVWDLTAQDQENIRWYLEDYLHYPIDPAPQIAARIEARVAEIGRELFAKVFDGNRDTMRVWDQVADRLPNVRVEVVATVEEATAIPWELLRDPATEAVVALRAHAFVRTDPHGPQTPLVARAGDVVRVLLAICRPGGADDVPFRSVASHLVRLSRTAREAFQFDVLRPATFARLAKVLEAAKQAERAYHVVHFDGHGAYLDQAQLAAAANGGFAADPLRFSVLSEVRDGSHGYLLFEDPDTTENCQLVDGPALGRLLFETGVPVLVLNACRSAHADLVTEPQTEADNVDAHQRVRTYGSLAQEVIHSGVGGVVAMRYNVYVVTAAQFVGDLYAALADGQPLGQAVTAGRRQLAARPDREIALGRRPLRDWMVPIVYETVPAPLLATRPASGLTITLSQAEAAPKRARLDPSVPADPDVGFYGRDETLLALDRAFDTQSIVLLWACAGAGKTATAVEFAHWYQHTGGLDYAGGDGRVLFTTFTRHTPLTRVLDGLSATFSPALQAVGVHWDGLSDVERRQVALQVLGQVPVLWIWDNVEPVAGFPTGTPSMWTEDEQAELVDFLRDLRATKAKVLLTSRREERGWLGDLPARTRLPAMPMAERVQLARAIAAKHGRRLADVQDWRPLLEFTAGNPLTITMLVGQALRNGLSTKAEVEAFVAKLRAGTAKVSDDVAQGRDRSLSASLSYGLDHAFTEPERGQLALLHLFQGFVNIAALQVMGHPDAEWCMSQVRGLSREQGIGLLDRAVEIGLLTAYGAGFYSIHPALPWFFQQLFTHHYGPPDQHTAKLAVRAYVEAIGQLGRYYNREYGNGRAEIVGVLKGEEANLLHARQLARAHGWWPQAMRVTQGLHSLYGHIGRTGEWRRLVDELIPDLIDPVTDGPLPGREDHWSIFTNYRVELARNARDWASAQRLQHARVDWDRQQAATALARHPNTLNDDQRNRVRTLAVSMLLLGHLLREQGHPGCVQHYQEAVQLCRRIDARQEEAGVAFSLGTVYLNVPALRSLDQAEAWYQTALQLYAPGDQLGRAGCVGQLGRVALERFDEAWAAGVPAEELFGHLNAAAAAYHQALDLLPEDAVPDLAATYNQLGVIYRQRGVMDTALAHWRKAIHYMELCGTRYGAGHTRFNVAITLANADQLEDALLYAKAALRDYEQVGVGATAAIDKSRRLVDVIEQALGSSLAGGKGQDG